MYLVHYTSLRNYERILKDGMIKPLGIKNEAVPRHPNLSPEEWIYYKQLPIKERNDYKKSVFLSLLPIIDGKGAWKKFEPRTPGVYLFLNIELLKDYESLFCLSQNSILKRQKNLCRVYDTNKSLNYNLKNWIGLLSQNSSELHFSKNGIIENEILIQGNIPLKYLEFIHFTDSSRKPLIPFV